jgi:hypothetical protein
VNVADASDRSAANKSSVVSRQPVAHSSGKPQKVGIYCEMIDVQLSLVAPSVSYDFLNNHEQGSSECRFSIDERELKK